MQTTQQDKAVSSNMPTTQQDKTISSNMQTTQHMTDTEIQNDTVTSNLQTTWQMVDAAIEDKTVSGKVICARLKHVKTSNLYTYNHSLFCNIGVVHCTVTYRFKHLRHLIPSG